MCKRLVIVCVCLVLWCGLAAAAEMPTVHIASDGAPAPKWAIHALDWLDAMSLCYHTLLDKLVDGKVDIPPVKEITENGGCDDDWAEGLAMWDFYALNRFDERIHKAYVKFWNAIFQERRMPKTNPFWCRGGFDAEHYSELFQLLWGGIELDPTNEKLIADNRRCLDFVIGDYYDPKVRLFKQSWHLRTRPGERPGDIALNTIWLTAAFHAYLTTGEKKYRDWALEYGTSWNDLARDNGGIFPYYVPPGTRKLDENWHKTTWKDFGYDTYGITTAMRALNTLPTTLCLLDRGDPKHVDALINMLDVLFAKGKNGLPAAFYDGKDFVRTDRGNWSVPRLLNHAYALTFEPRVEKMMKNYFAATANVKEAATEREFLRYPMFYYFGEGSIDDVAVSFRNGAGRARDRAKQYRAGKAPTKGDDIREQYTPYVAGMEYVVGSFWGRYDNGRCGGPVSGSVRYYTGDGKSGLPSDIAALVQHVGKDRVVLLLHNRAKAETALIITAGWYGQHRWKSAAVNDGEAAAVGDRRLKAILAAGATGKLTLEIQRFVNEPTLEPQKGE